MMKVNRNVYSKKDKFADYFKITKISSSPYISYFESFEGFYMYIF